MATTYQSHGFFKEAQHALESAQPVAASSPEHDDDGLLVAAWGDHLLTTHREKAAVEKLQNGIVQFKNTDDVLILVRLYHLLGNGLTAQSRFQEAEKAFRHALSLLPAQSYELPKAEIHHNLAHMHFRAGQSDEGSKAIQTSLHLFDQLSDQPSKGLGLVSLGRMLLDAHRQTQDQSGERLRLALQILKNGGDVAERILDVRMISYALGYQGEVYELDGRWKDAMRLTQRALFHAQSVAASDSLYLWQWQQGRIHARQGQVQEAIQSYRAAMTTLGGLRQDLLRGSRNAPDSFRTLIAPVYYQLADLLFRQADRAESVEQRNVLMLEARETIETLKTSEIRNLFQDACMAAPSEQGTGRETAPPRTAIFYPVLLEDRLELLLTLPDGIRRHTVAISARAIEEKTRQLRSVLESVEEESYRLNAQRLYRWLIEPLLGDLRGAGIRTLVVVPDGPLRTIPFAALHDGKRFLIEEFAVSVTPSLKMTDTRIVQRSGGQMMISALSESRDGFAPLPHVDEEVEQVKEVIPAKVLRNQEFTVGGVVEQVEKNPFSIVHIASHGQFDRDPRNTFLLAYDGKLTMDTLESLVGSKGSSDQPVELLTLSACQTAVGDDRAALGLAGVAIKAGARSALASLWLIDDEATSVLMSKFYRGLQEDRLTKAEALRQAQIALLKEPRFEHPGLWSALILIGNWM
ncbi:MAG: CHAT domain-containing protein [Magnetococcales bacterium]|nr:CHAT domain-containing protein [Magnetococcales bacterium]